MFLLVLMTVHYAFFFCITVLCSSECFSSSFSSSSLNSYIRELALFEMTHNLILPWEKYPVCCVVEVLPSFLGANES
uniref:Putative secreted peptide n=1 Tax=Anopheles braziliensis TaxID=58242 RepID=A0A2M3ZW90_9DIPT